MLLLQVDDPLFIGRTQGPQLLALCVVSVGQHLLMGRSRIVEPLLVNGLGPGERCIESLL